MTRRKARPKLRGTVAQRGSSYRLRFDAGTDPITGKRVRITETHPDEDTAYRRLVELNAEAERTPTTNARTVGDAITRYLEEMDGEWSPSTLRGYGTKARTFLYPAFGTTPLRSLRAEDVAAFYASLRKAGSAKSSRRQTAVILRGALDLAVRNGWASENVARGIRPPKVGKASESLAKRGVMSAADIARVMVEAGDDLALAIILGMSTGRRRGELCGIRWEDVDLDAATLTIRRTIAILDGGKLEVVDDERRKSITEELPLDEFAVDALKERRRKARETALAFGVKLREDAYVLSEVPGGRDPLSPERITARWRTASARAEVPFRFHDLRHFHVSALIDAGLDVTTIADLVGHANGQITLTVYAHRLRKRDRRSVDAMRAHVEVVATAAGM